MQAKDIYQRYNTCTIKRSKVQGSKFKVQSSVFKKKERS